MRKSTQQAVAAEICKINESPQVEAKADAEREVGTIELTPTWGEKGVAMTEQSEYTTRATYLGDRYGCRVLRGGRVVVEGQCQTRDQIGATFRDLFRTLDKLGGDAFTSAARKRKYREGNAVASVKHLWGGWGGRAQQA